MRSDLGLKAYLAVSGAIFLFVALFHLLRILNDWPIVVGATTSPPALSYAGLPVASAWAAWAFWLLRRGARSSGRP